MTGWMIIRVQLPRQLAMTDLVNLHARLVEAVPESERPAAMRAKYVALGQEMRILAPVCLGLLPALRDLHYTVLSWNEIPEDNHESDESPA